MQEEEVKGIQIEKENKAKKSSLFTDNITVV